MRYREATVADRWAVAQAHVESWQRSFVGAVPQSFLDKMSVERRAQAFAGRFTEAGYKMYVAETAARKIVGFVDFGLPRARTDVYAAELYAIYLLPEFQRQGIGGRLFDLVVADLAAQGKCSMYLLALTVSPYRSFYEKMGGRIVGSEHIEIEGIEFAEYIYGWDKLC